MTLPNKLTLARTALIPLFVWCALASWHYASFAALLLFVAAALTDKLDGYLARKLDLVTSFGKIMDPLADKLLVSAAFLVFLQQGRMDAVAVWLVVARELAVSSLRVVAMGSGKLMPAAFSGKVKTAVQFGVVIALLLQPRDWLPYGAAVEAALGWLAAAAALWSGFDYFWANRAIIKTSTRK